MKTIKLFGGDLGNETMLVRCDLTQASAPVQVDYQNGDDTGWQATQYQCADTRHRVSGLVELAKSIAAAAVEMAESEFKCDWEEV